MNKFIKYIWQLIISTSNATLEVPSLRPLCFLLVNHSISLDTSGKLTVRFFLKITSPSWIILPISLDELNSIDWLLKSWWWIFLKLLFFYCGERILIWQKSLEFFFRKQKGTRVYQWQEDIHVVVISALLSTKRMYLVPFCSSKLVHFFQIFFPRNLLFRQVLRTSVFLNSKCLKTSNKRTHIHLFISQFVSLNDELKM